MLGGELLSPGLKWDLAGGGTLRSRVSLRAAQWGGEVSCFTKYENLPLFIHLTFSVLEILNSLTDKTNNLMMSVESKNK